MQYKEEGIFLKTQYEMTQRNKTYLGNTFNEFTKFNY